MKNQSNTAEKGNRRLPNESQRDFLIRTGKITPFSKFRDEPSSKTEVNLSDALYNAEAAPAEEETTEPQLREEGPRSHRILHQPGFLEEDETSSARNTGEESRSRKRRRPEDEVNYGTNRQARKSSDMSGSDGSAYSPQDIDAWSASAKTLDSDISSDNDEFLQTKPPPGRKRRQPKQQAFGKDSGKDVFIGLDDGNEKVYQARLQDWITRRRTARLQATRRNQISHSNQEAEPADDEIYLPHPTVSDAALDNAYRIPGDIYPSLFDYQKTGVQWLWELYSQQVGGIVGDEMGLGKTIQVISFLAGLHYSRKITRPIIVVAPATVMKQWVNEFHTWWPPFRVSILHSSGSGMIDIGRESRREEDLLSRRPSTRKTGAAGKSQRAAQKIVDRVVNEGHVLITTYSGLQTYAELLVPVVWEYAVLDEGHKVRNPNAGMLSSSYVISS